ncbi:Transthyretin-like family protein [Ostertagia ostertagi]
MYRVVFAIVVLAVCEAVRDQSIAVKGRLLCGTGPAKNVRVKLIDTDTGQFPLKNERENLSQAYADHACRKGYTDDDPRPLSRPSGGTGHETTDIDPILRIYHDCNDVTGIANVPKPGSRKVTFRLPGKYITYAKQPKTTMDIGAINLELHFQDEGRDYIVS